MAAEFAGKWDFVSSDNFDAYLKEVGVGVMTRTVAGKLKPTLIFEVNGDDWSMTSESTFKTHVTKWKNGVAFDDKTADGRDVTQLFTFENGTLIQQETGKNGGKDTVFERYIEGGNTLHIKGTSGSVSFHRVYQKAA